MMSVILLLIAFFSILLIKNCIQDKLSKFVGYCFVLYWFGSLIYSTTRPLGLYPISGYAYLLLIIGGLSFVSGMLLVGNRKVIINKKIGDNSSFVESILLNKMVIAFLAILSIYFIFFLREALVYSQMMESAARVSADEELYSTNKLFLFTYNYVGFMCFHFFNYIFWESVFNIKKRIIFPLCIVFIYLLVFCMLNGGRNVVMISFLYFIFILLKKRNFSLQFSFKYLLRIVLGFILVLFLVASITAYRRSGTFKMESNEVNEGIELAVERFMSYSTLPFVLFDRSLSNDYYSKLDAPYYGRATFSGLDNLMWAVVRYVYNYDRTSETVVRYVQDNFFPVSNTTDSNYAYTGLLYHYLDFGFIGIIIFPLLFGVTYRFLICRIYATGNNYLLIMAAFCFFIMLHSVFTCYFIKGWTLIYCAILLYIAKISKVKGSE